MPDFKKQLTTFVQMLRNIEDEFKLQSLTPNEQAVFYTILKSNNVCNISMIVDESGLSRSTVYKILRKLEDNNLIEALQSELDKRESIVSLKV
jgi:DNA-binding MarR family transcriptional regulator